MKVGKTLFLSPPPTIINQIKLPLVESLNPKKVEKKCYKGNDNVTSFKFEAIFLVISLGDGIYLVVKEFLQAIYYFKFVYLPINHLFTVTVTLDKDSLLV